MSEKEELIAVAALREYAASDYDEFFAEIADYTGYPAAEVEEILADLVVDKTLSETYVQMLSPAPQIEGPGKIVRAWYEKGPMWNTPRTTNRR
ncbi:MAG: hypothetical protein KGN79_12520 [Acidobacteriota bacterium]|nr:hypothetical protein [Acidobacteriota bacterium]